MKIGYTFVSGDLFHYGHLHFLQECSKHCDFLIVGVQTDKVISSYKRDPIIPFKERIAIIDALCLVGCVVTQSSRDTVPAMKKLVKKGFDIKVLFHADDWKKVPGKEWIEARGGKLIQPKYYKGISTSIIIDRIRRHDKRNKN